MFIKCNIINFYFHFTLLFLLVATTDTDPAKISPDDDAGSEGADG